MHSAADDADVGVHERVELRKRPYALQSQLIEYVARRNFRKSRVVGVNREELYGFRGARRRVLGRYRYERQRPRAVRKGDFAQGLCEGDFLGRDFQRYGISAADYAQFHGFALGNFREYVG